MSLCIAIYPAGFLEHLKLPNRFSTVEAKPRPMSCSRAKFGCVSFKKKKPTSQVMAKHAATAKFGSKNGLRSHKELGWNVDGKRFTGSARYPPISGPTTPLRPFQLFQPSWTLK